MKIDSCTFLPKARSVKIITKDVDGEVLVYDLVRDKAHCLNETAAAVWKLCDGRMSVSEISLSVSKSLGISVGEVVVQLALKQLSGNHLLAEGYEVASLPVNSSRRALVRRLGIGVALLPLITSLNAPTALAAVSCGGPCTGGPGKGSCPPGCVCSPITGTCTT
jgi:hypothetical protein